jgi:hypothetical protein
MTMGTHLPVADAAVTVTSLRDRRVPLFVRVRTDLEAVLIDLTYGRAIHGRVENVSVGGLLFRGADALAVGTRVLCALVVGWNGRTEEVYAAGTVVHRHDHGVGIAFDEVTPVAFQAISRMIADAGCFRMRPIEARCPSAEPAPAPGPTDARRGERKRPRPRKARMLRWAAARRAG